MDDGMCLRGEIDNPAASPPPSLWPRPRPPTAECVCAACSSLVLSSFCFFSPSLFGLLEQVQGQPCGSAPHYTVRFSPLPKNALPQGYEHPKAAVVNPSYSSLLPFSASILRIPCGTDLPPSLFLPSFMLRLTRPPSWAGVKRGEEQEEQEGGRLIGKAHFRFSKPAK